jgi:uncharacterized repeat protein (TIGR01451 family)
MALVAVSLAPALAQTGPSNVSVTPSSGSGASQTFAFASSSPNGYDYINSMQAIFNYGVDGGTACDVVYVAASNALYLIANSGIGVAASGYVGVAGAGTISNSQCAVNLATSSVSGSSDTLTLHLAISFQAAFIGPQNIYMYTTDNAGLSTSFQQEGTWTAYQASSTQPATATVAPSSGSGLSQVFTYTVSDLNGFGYIPYFLVLFNTSVTGVNGCYLEYSQNDNLILLYNNAATAVTSATPGSATVLSNSQCSVSAAQSTVSGSGNNLVVSLAITFASGFSGAKNNYVYAVDHANQTSGWQQVGTWTVGAVSQPPTDVSVVPSSGSGVGPQTFSFTAASVNGSSYIAWMQIIFNYAVTSPGACYFYFSPSNNLIYLNNNDGGVISGTGWIGSATLGSSGTLQNGQCSLNLATASFSGAGDNLTLNLPLTFKAGLPGPQNVYMAVGDNGGLASSWTQLGTWTAWPLAAPNQGPTVVSAAPTAGVGGVSASQTFSYTASSPNGPADILELLALLNTSTNGVGACYIEYSPQQGAIYLYNDTGTAVTYGAPGSTGTLSNSQCTLNLAASSVVISGNNLTLNVALTFGASWAGMKNQYMVVEDRQLNIVGWTQMGTWTVGTPSSLTISSTHTGNFVQEQTNATYSVTVSNSASAGPTSGTVTASETVPSGLTLVSMSGTGWSCSGISCARSDALNAAASYPAITVTVNVAANASSPQVNSVSVSGGGSASASGTDSTVIAQGPALTVSSTHSGSFVQGQTGAAYTVSVSNVGPSPTAGTVTVTDSVSGGLTLASMTGTGWTCGSGACTRSDALSSVSGPWYSSSWAHRKPITISQAAVSGTATLTNFPVLVSLPTDANLQAEAQTNGYDILFTDATGSVKLNHEIEQYVSSNGQLIAWVQIPSLSPAAITTIYMYYGNASAANQQSPAAVWNAGYHGVWHFSGTSSLSLTDSTAYGNAAYNTNLVGVAPAQIGEGASFSRSYQHLQWPVSASLEPAQLSLSCWFKTSASNSGYQYALDSNYDSNGFTWRFAPNDGGYYVTLGNVVLNAYSPKTFGGGMHYLTVTYDGSNVKTYIDGILDINQAVSGSPAIQWPSSETVVGSTLGDTYQYSGLIDELRLSSAALTAGWIATEYNNQSSPGTFFSLGSEQEPANAGSSTYPPIAVAVNVTSNAASPQVNSVTVSGGGSASASTTDSTIILPSPHLTISSTHSGNFVQGQIGVYTLTVSNQTGASATTGTVTVTDTLPSGMTLVSVAGSGWTCASNICTTSTVLQPGTSYQAITATASVSASASSPETNQATVSGGGSASAAATDSTIIQPIVLTSISISPPTVISTNTATLTVTLTAPAPAGGTVVTLSSNNTSGFNPPASITIPAGQTTGTATVTAGTVSASTSITVTGNYGGTQTGSVTVLPLPTVSAVSISPSSIAGGGSATVSVTLSAAAPSSGAAITLSSTNTSVFNLPASITVAAGQTSGSTGSITAGAVTSAASVTVTGTYNNSSQSGGVTVNPAPQITPGSTPATPLSPGGQLTIFANQAVTWSVSPSSAGGLSSSSSIANQNITFTAATPIPNNDLSTTITATNGTGTASSVVVNLLPPVSITPSSAGSLAAGATQTFSTNIPVNWAVSPSNGGTFSLTATTGGQQTTFTMGSAGNATVTVTATDQRYSTNSSWVTIGEPPTITPGSTPAAPLSPGGTLTISANQAVTWSVVPASAGTFSSPSSIANANDTFTVANLIPNSALSATITATGAGGATAQLLVNLVPAVTITPATPTALASGITAQFSANIPVNWTVPTTNGGSVSPTVTAAGQATTFTMGTASGSVTLTATDQRFSTNSSSVTIPPGTVASPTSVSPNVGDSSQQTFTFTFSDTGGASTLTAVSVLVATGTSSMANSCEITFNTAQNSLALLTDAGTPPSSTITPTIGNTPGSGTAQNSQCIVTGSGSAVSKSGNVLTLTLMLGFTAAYTGDQNIYGAAQDATGSSSGWQTLGAWAVPGVPTLLQMDPVTTTVYAGATTPLPLNFTFHDTAGWTDIALIEISIGVPNASGPVAPANGCTALYQPASLSMVLATDQGGIPSPGTGFIVNQSGGPLSNSQCTLTRGTGSNDYDVEQTNGSPEILVRLHVTFTSAYEGLQPVYALASNAAGQSSGWIQVGTVTVNNAGSVTIYSVTVNGSSSSTTLTAGQTAVVQVVLTGAAPTSGASVTLTSTSPATLSVPPLAIPAGLSRGQVTVTAQQPASGPVGVYVEASYGAVQGAPSPLILVEGVNYPVTTLVTSPPGLMVTVDGVNQTTPYSIVWTSTSSHTITVPGGAQAGSTGAQYILPVWSDGGGLSHLIYDPSPGNNPIINNTITASFTTQYYLTTGVNQAGAGTITPASGWQTPPVTISATPTANSAYLFSSYTCTPSCTVTGVSGSANTGSLAMTGPETVTANFSGSPTTQSIASLTISPSPLVSGGSATVTVSMNQGSSAAVMVGLGVSGSGAAAFGQMPSTVTIPANQTSGSASFSVGTVTGSNSVTPTVRASYESNNDTLSGTFTAVSTPGSGNGVSREYIRLGGRVIAIENPPASVAAPVMSPAPGAYAVGQTVTLTAAAGATIYYTTNGSTPSPTNGTQYSSSSPIQVTATVPIMAVAVVSGVSSAAAMGTYTIDAAVLELDILRRGVPWQSRRSAIAAAVNELPVDFSELYRSQAAILRRKANVE